MPMISAGPRCRTKSSCGTSMSDRTARVCRMAAVRRRTARRFTLRIVRPVMGRMARGASRTASLAGRALLHLTTPSRPLAATRPTRQRYSITFGRAMPYQAPGSLSVDDTYAVTAYILSFNEILPADGKLDKDSLPKIKMPNRDDFIPDAVFKVDNEVQS